VCTINSNINITKDGNQGVNKTVSITGNVVVAGNVSITGGVTVSLTPGSRLDVEKCLTFSDGATVVVIVTSTTANGTVVASFDPSCSTVPPATVTSDLDKCQYGVASTQTVPDSGNRVRLEVIFTSVETTECNNGTSNVQGGLTSVQTIGIIVGCVVGGLVLIILAIVFGVRPIRQKIFPYSQRDAPKTKDVEMSPTGSDSGAAGQGKQSLPDIDTHEESPMQRSWTAASSPRPV
jgi:tetrahydromethanopterin S-methyltransferase subunit B